MPLAEKYKYFARLVSCEQDRCAGLKPTVDWLILLVLKVTATIRIYFWLHDVCYTVQH